MAEETKKLITRGQIRQLDRREDNGEIDFDLFQMILNGLNLIRNLFKLPSAVLGFWLNDDYGVQQLMSATHQQFCIVPNMAHTSRVLAHMKERRMRPATKHDYYAYCAVATEFERERVAIACLGSTTKPGDGKEFAPYYEFGVAEQYHDLSEPWKSGRVVFLAVRLPNPHDED